MQTLRRYGTTDLHISPLGLGAAQLGDPALDEQTMARLIHAAIDLGIHLFDTAPSYGISEQRLGRHLGARRNKVILSTKLGYGVEGVPDWTGACITAGVERALRLLRSDYIDIAHLHSCPSSMLENSDVIDALQGAQRAGKLRAIAYSGENEDLNWAIQSGRFDGFMASLSICDQRIIEDALPALKEKGFIAKRTVANYPWRFDARPVGNYCEEYWVRWKAMGANNHDLSWGELSLRFALTVNGVSSTIVGTSSLDHMKEAVQWASQGPLSAHTMQELQAAFKRADSNWIGQI